MNPSGPSAEPAVQEARAAARAKGVLLHVMKASTEKEFEPFAALVQMRAAALVVAPDAFFNSRRETLVALAAHHAVPAIYQGREFVPVAWLV